MASDAADADIDAGASQGEQPMRTSMHPSNAPRSLEPVETAGWRATQPMRTSMRAPRGGSDLAGCNTKDEQTLRPVATVPQTLSRTFQRLRCRRQRGKRLGPPRSEPANFGLVATARTHQSRRPTAVNSDAWTYAFALYACAVISKCVNRSTAQDPRGEEVLTTRDRSCLDFAERRSSPRSSLRHDESGGEEVLTLTRATMPGMATEADSHEGKRTRQPLRSAR